MKKYVLLIILFCVISAQMFLLIGANEYTKGIDSVRFRMENESGFGTDLDIELEMEKFGFVLGFDENPGVWCLMEVGFLTITE